MIIQSAVLIEELTAFYAQDATTTSAATPTPDEADAAPEPMDTQAAAAESEAPQKKTARKLKAEAKAAKALSAEAAAVDAAAAKVAAAQAEAVEAEAAVVAAAAAMQDSQHATKRATQKKGKGMKRMGKRAVSVVGAEDAVVDGVASNEAETANVAEHSDADVTTEDAQPVAKRGATSKRRSKRSATAANDIPNDATTSAAATTPFADVTPVQEGAVGICASPVPALTTPRRTYEL